GARRNVSSAAQLAMDPRDAFDLAFGRETLVKAFVAEGPDLLAQGESRSRQRSTRPSSGSASREAKSAQTRIMALSVTGLVAMKAGLPQASRQTSAAALRKSRTIE